MVRNAGSEEAEEGEGPMHPLIVATLVCLCLASVAVVFLAAAAAVSAWGERRENDDDSDAPWRESLKIRFDASGNPIED